MLLFWSEVAKILHIGVCLWSTVFTSEKSPNMCLLITICFLGNLNFWYVWGQYNYNYPHKLLYSLTKLVLYTDIVIIVVAMTCCFLFMHSLKCWFSRDKTFLTYLLICKTSFKTICPFHYSATKAKFVTLSVCNILCMYENARCLYQIFTI